MLDEAKAAGIPTRTREHKVSVASCREDLSNAETLKKQGQRDLIGYGAKQEIRVKEIRRRYMDDVQKKAKETGIIALPRSPLHVTESLSLFLETLKKAIRIPHVHTLAVQGRRELFELNAFNRMLDLLRHTSVFAINLGEDSGNFGEDHFKSLASRILSGDSSIRRWFVEIDAARRRILENLRLVRTKNEVTVFTTARNEDRRLWRLGDHKSPRLAWLRASLQTYIQMDTQNVTLQDSLTKFTNKNITAEIKDGEGSEVHEDEEEKKEETMKACDKDNGELDAEAEGIEEETMEACDAEKWKREQIALRKKPIDRDEMKHFQKMLRMKKDKILFRHFNVDITVDIISCLRNENWLNDEVVNFYMCLLQDRSKQNFTESHRNYSYRPLQMRSSHYFNSFFMAKLLEDGIYNFSRIKKWTKKINVFEQERIFFPLNVGNVHWNLLVVFVQEKKICYYDSKHGDGKRYLEALMQWVEDIGQNPNNNNQHKVHVDKKNWTLLNVSGDDFPYQTNEFDCGIFVCMFSDFLTDGLPLNELSENDMKHYRQKIGTDILRKTLNYTE